MSIEPEHGDSPAVEIVKHLVKAARLTGPLMEDGLPPIDYAALIFTMSPHLLAEIDKLETALEKAEDKYEMANTSWVNASAEEKQRHQTMVDSIRATNRELNEKCESWSEKHSKLIHDQQLLEESLEKALDALIPKPDKTVSKAKVDKARRALNDVMDEVFGERL